MTLLRAGPCGREAGAGRDRFGQGGGTARVRTLAGAHAPDHDISADRPLITDTDASLITAHSDKEQAAPAFKRRLGIHPLWTFAGHGGEGTG